MRELRTGMWHWEAPHPEWKSGEEWLKVVSSYAIDDGDRLLLFDPLALPSEIEELAAGRETAVVLTCPWHRRDALSLAERLGVQIYVPPRMRVTRSRWTVRCSGRRPTAGRGRVV